MNRINFSKTQLAQEKAIKAYVISVLGDDQSGHGLDHIKRVVKTSRVIAEETSDISTDDYFITITAAWLHDVTDKKLVVNTQQAQVELKKFLTSINLIGDQIETVMFIINHLSYSDSLSGKIIKLPLSGQIVQDADRLDAMGAIGIARAFYYGGHKGNKLYDLAETPRSQMNEVQYHSTNSSVLNHFYEKLLKLNDLLNTPVGKIMGAKRQQVLQAFVAEFKAEIE